MPAFSQAQKDNPNIHFVFANQGDSMDKIKNFISQNNLQLKNVITDPNNLLAQKFNVGVFPTTLFLMQEQS